MFYIDENGSRPLASRLSMRNAGKFGIIDRIS